VDDGSTIHRDPNGDYQVDPDGAGPARPFTIGNPDVAIAAMHATLVVRWEYRPGASVFAVWTQRRNGFERTGDFGTFADLPSAFDLPPENVFLVKASYWFSR
jgi:hypothetical protein